MQSFYLTNEFFGVRIFKMKKLYKNMINVLLLIPFFSVITFCCCLEKDADASVENISMEHHEKLEKSVHHSEHQHQNSNDQDECSCPKHLSFLSENTIDITPQFSSFQLLTNDFLAFPPFEVALLSTSSLHSQGPPGQDHRDQVSIPIFLKNSNLRL